MSRAPRHADRLLEASLAMKAPDGTPIPGYGWMFPAGDGTVNLGVGALSTMKGFKALNLNHLCDIYRDLVRDEWEIGDYLEKPRAWRLPMSVTRRHGAGWVAIGDAAGLVNPMNGEGIDYGLESGMLAADLFLENPATAPERYDRLVGERFDSFLRTGRRFSLPHRPPVDPADRPPHGRRHPGHRRADVAGDGQPRRQRDARERPGGSCA
jgi:menaquinone-9 beta-reductase